MKRLAIIVGLLVCASAFAPEPARAADAGADAERAARWKDIRETIFAERRIEPTATRVTLDAPVRALDASLVPLTLTMPDAAAITAVHLVIDENPSPYAAHLTFGPAADPREIKLRVRINSYTNVHAVAETRDGRLFETAKFVKASGGCSAPMGVSEDQAMAGMGEMRMKFAPGAPGAKSVAATLMIRHPNFSGMQMDQVTRLYTPARYVQTVAVSQGGVNIFKLAGDISLSTDPVIGFAFKAGGKGPIRVVATDNQNGRWERSFDPPATSLASLGS